MTSSDPSLTEVRDPVPAGPTRVARRSRRGAGPPALPSHRASTGPLQTALFGPLTVPDGADRAAEIEELSPRAELYATRARGDSTRRAYRSAWRSFEAWCQSLGREPLAADPDTIAMYVVRCADAGFSVSSIRVHLAQRSAPRICSPASPSTCATRASPWWSKTSPAPKASGRAVSGRPRRARCAAADARPTPRPPTPRAAPASAPRCWSASAPRCAVPELALTLGDVETVPGRGLRVLVRRSKTDKQGQGQAIAVWANPAEPAFCHLAALDTWLTHRRTAPDLDWTASASSRAERPLVCAVTKAAKITGTASPIRRSPVWSSGPASTRSATPGTRSAPGSPPPPAMPAQAAPN